uniref:Uncharacterized protein n=1 Tax=Anguilla anguilla TaxID=7936 RepID=A0A0E9WII9_ANGAN
MWCRIYHIKMRGLLVRIIKCYRLYLWIKILLLND